MRLPDWDALPPELRTPQVRPYYDSLRQKKASLAVKRLFDIAGALVLLLALWPVFCVLALAVRLDSPGPALFSQVRLTRFGRPFRMYKFRTMEQNAPGGIAVRQDRRITRAGAFLRRTHLDELPQLVSVLAGDMTFVGPRPELPEYFSSYGPEMLATLLLPAGLTGRASLAYREEALLLTGEDAEQTYRQKILPAKMKLELEALERFSLRQDGQLLAETLLLFARGGR